jgi:hypothetical protein
MSVAATGLQPSPAPFRLSRSKGGRRVLHALLRALDRLAPPRGAREDAELPGQWFKYPPI